MNDLSIRKYDKEVIKETDEQDTIEILFRDNYNDDDANPSTRIPKLAY